MIPRSNEEPGVGDPLSSTIVTDKVPLAHYADSISPVTAFDLRNICSAHVRLKKKLT